MNVPLNRIGALVCIVDDDEVVRESLRLLIETQGIKAKAFGSCAEFLDDSAFKSCSCLILDVRLPGISGLQLQQRLQALPDMPPIIFISGHADVPTAVQAMRAGAIDFLQKPFPEQALLDRIEQALDITSQRRQQRVVQSTLAARFSQLTQREKEVLEHVIKGRANKQIAADLGISVKTVEQHRSKVMTKMRAGSLAELVQSVERLRRS